MGIPTAAPRFTTKSFRALVREVDPDYDQESRRPIVYRFHRPRRDPGDQGGAYVDNWE